MNLVSDVRCGAIGQSEHRTSLVRPTVASLSPLHGCVAEIRSPFPLFEGKVSDGAPRLPRITMSLTSLKTNAASVEVDGHQLKCLMCGHESFHKRRSHIATALVTSMNPEWMDRQASCLVCDHCGFIHWFLSN
ncbi:MAG TPA: hypothetical protein DCE44_17940 [Verrucomicrobiales bacterium]|nr:hypothetical protein [Verrucomicrobiales bacterium]